MFAITQAVAAFVSEFEWGDGKTSVQYVVESALLELCTELSVLAADIKTVRRTGGSEVARRAGRLPGLRVDDR